MPLAHTLTIHHGEQVTTLTAEDGANLRRTLLAAGITPYGSLSRRANCGGRGLCATCGVRLSAQDAPPQHWHDRIGNRFGYPRLSCQITITTDLDIEILTDKWMWGAPRRAE